MSDFRAMMKARAGASGSASIALGKEKARQLKIARQQQHQSLPVNQLVGPSGQSKEAVSLVIAPEKKKSKTIEIASLTKDDPDQIQPIHHKDHADIPIATVSSQFAYGGDEIDGDVDQPELLPAMRHGETDERQFYMPSSLRTLNSSTDRTPVQPVSSRGLGLPQGFFDNPRKDIEARGLTVKGEIERKEKEQRDVLSAFFCEVNDMPGRDSAEDSDDSDDDDDNIDEEALQLAYETKAAALMATIEKSIDQLKGGFNETKRTDSAPIIEVTDIDMIIQEASGLSGQSGNIDIYNDVLSALRHKKRKLDEMPTPQEYHNRILTTNSSKHKKDEKETQDQSSADTSSDEDSYESLDFTDWQSRQL